jgi:hypothetical protein
VVVACLPSNVIDKISAAKVATQMLSIFIRLRFRLIVRVKGGVSNEEHNIQLKDIIINKPIRTFKGVI